MRRGLLMGLLMMLSGCAGLKHALGADQCRAPTPQEAKITKRVWR